MAKNYNKSKPPAKYLCEECGETTIVTDSMGENGLVVRYRKCPNGHRIKTLERPYLWSPAGLEIPMPNAERRSIRNGRDSHDYGKIWDGQLTQDG